MRTSVGRDADTPLALTQQEHVEHGSDNGEKRKGRHHPATHGSIVRSASRLPGRPAFFETGWSRFRCPSHARREIWRRNGDCGD